jgi:hypothetical protein
MLPVQQYSHLQLPGQHLPKVWHLQNRVDQTLFQEMDAQLVLFTETRRMVNRATVPMNDPGQVIDH